MLLFLFPHRLVVSTKPCPNFILSRLFREELDKPCYSEDRWCFIYQIKQKAIYSAISNSNHRSILYMLHRVHIFSVVVMTPVTQLPITLLSRCQSSKQRSKQRSNQLIPCLLKPISKVLLTSYPLAEVKSFDSLARHILS